MLEIGDSKGTLPQTPHRTEDDIGEMDSEAIDFAVRMLKTFFDTMND